jgi:hypothetical protein
VSTGVVVSERRADAPDRGVAEPLHASDPNSMLGEGRVSHVRVLFILNGCEMGRDMV